MRKIYLIIVALILVFSALLFYLVIPFYQLQFDVIKGYYLTEGNHRITLKVTAVLYAFYQIVIIYKAKGKTKIELLLDGIRNKGFTKVDWRNVRYAIVKLFFIPLMLPSAIIYFNLFLELFQKEIVFKGFISFFNGFVFTFIIYLVSFVTLAFYAFGYLFESNRLNSTVKSVDNTVLGWGVLLICYVPFFVIATQYIPFPTQDYAFFVNEEVTFFVRLFLSLVMLFKMVVVMQLGAKCSNLTNRGIVTSGAYRYIRHPHYLAKMIIWWITFLPFLIYNYWAIGPMFFWTIIYFLRALTEEKHLSKDEAYLNYKKDVKWMFIPRIL